MAFGPNGARRAESGDGPMSGASSPADVPRGQTPGHGRTSQVAGVVLAAGAATRFGAPKQRLLLPAVLERLGQSALGEIVVAAGAYSVEAEGVRVFAARSGSWDLGPRSAARSPRSGRTCEAAVVVLADGPDLAPEAVDRS